MDDEIYVLVYDRQNAFRKIWKQSLVNLMDNYSTRNQIVWLKLQDSVDLRKQIYLLQMLPKLGREFRR